MTTTAALTIRQGDTFVRVLTVTDEDGDAVVLTGATLTMHLRLPGAAADALAVALALTTPLSGIATLTLTAAQTAALTAGRSYRYDVGLVDAGGNTSTPVAGSAYIQG